MRESSETLTQAMSDLAKREGAFLVGIAGVDRFEGAPRGHHPADIVKGARSVISFGVPMIEQIADWDEMFQDAEFLGADVRKSVLQDYLYAVCNYNTINDRLDQIALRLTLELQARGYRSTMFPSTYGRSFEDFQAMVKGRRGLFSQRHAAVRAGLGEFGLNNVVVTPEYGPRVRFNSVITQATLEPSPLLAKKACLGGKCQKCVRHCGGEAITLLPAAADDRVWIDPVSRTDFSFCRERRGPAFCYGRCVQVCPVGRHTSPDGPRSEVN